MPQGTACWSDGYLATSRHSPSVPAARNQGCGSRAAGLGEESDQAAPAERDPHCARPSPLLVQEMLRHACDVRGPRAHMMLPLLCSGSPHMDASYAVAALAAAAHGGELPLAQTRALLSAVEGPCGWPASALHYAPVCSPSLSSQAAVFASMSSPHVHVAAS